MKHFVSRFDHDLLQRSRDLIPGGTSTSAKSPNRLFAPITPSFAKKARGATFIDVRGRTWLDCNMGLGGVVWGHANNHIDRAAIRQIKSGVLFSIPHPIEVISADRVLARLDYFDSIRFFKTGAEAVSAAVRVARAVTGRSRIVSGTYHGWHDWSAVGHYGERESLGIPSEIGNLTHFLDEEDRNQAMTALLQPSVAALVVCPEHWTADDLRRLKKDCHRKGSLLVFDEIKSGMRSGLRGTGQAMGTVPDLLCLGKGLANGYPLAALVGPLDLMEHCVTARITSTYATESVSLAAAAASEELLADSPDWPAWARNIDRLAEGASTAIVAAGLEDFLALTIQPGTLSFTTPCRTSEADIFVEHLVKTMARRQIFTAGDIILSAAHRKSHLDRIEEALIDAIAAWPDDGPQFMRK